MRFTSQYSSERLKGAGVFHFGLRTCCILKPHGANDICGDMYGANIEFEGEFLAGVPRIYLINEI